MEETARLFEERVRKQDYKLTFIRKFFPNTNLQVTGERGGYLNTWNDCYPGNASNTVGINEKE